MVLSSREHFLFYLLFVHAYVCVYILHLFHVYVRILCVYLCGHAHVNVRGQLVGIVLSVYHMDPGILLALLVTNI